MSMGQRYSVYNRKTDQPIYIYGTAQQCAAAMGVTVHSFYTARTRSQKGQNKKYEIFDDGDEVDGDDLD